MQKSGRGDPKENPCWVRINSMGSIRRYSDFFNNPKALSKLQSQLDLGKSLKRASKVNSQEAVYNRALKVSNLDGVLSLSIRMFKGVETTRRIFTKDHTKSNLLICYKTNPFRRRKQGPCQNIWKLNSMIIHKIRSHIKGIHFLMPPLRK